MRSSCAALFLVASIGWFAPGDVSAADPARASRDDLGDRPYWRRNLFRRFATDQKVLVTDWWPAEFRSFRFSLPMALAVAGASGSRSGGVDLSWERRMNAWTVGGRRDVARAFSRLGEADSGIVLIGGVYLISRWTGAERTQRAASLSAEALMSTAVYAGIIKRLTRRTRPSSAGTGQFFVSRPGAGQETTSFPSGHAMGSFAVATVFAREFRDKRWVAWTAYGTASLIALSRVGLGRHFPSDILAGAVLGNSIGRMVSDRNGGLDSRHPGGRLEPIFDPTNGGVGVGFRKEW